MRFVHPEYLWLLLALPLLALAGWWSLRRRRTALIRFAGGAAYVGRFVAGVSVHHARAPTTRRLRNRKNFCERKPGSQIDLRFLRIALRAQSGSFRPR